MSCSGAQSVETNFQNVNFIEGAGKRIQCFALNCFFEQLVVFVLSVNIYQQLTEFSQ